MEEQCRLRGKAAEQINPPAHTAAQQLLLRVCAHCHEISVETSRPSQRKQVWIRLILTQWSVLLNGMDGWMNEKYTMQPSANHPYYIF